MPSVEGESLRDRLQREHQLPVEEAIRIATEVADALDYAHRHGVVHRDIKPENILLHEGRVQMADFGIALAVSTAGGGTRMTETGMSLGTPHYMAPEQAMGEKEITPKADIYALGCVLYEMLVGEPPFTGPTAQAIIARVVTEEPRSLVIQRHTIPAHVETVVRKALEKLPADRFASATQFAEALTHPGSLPLTGAGTGMIAARPAMSRWAVWGARLAIPMIALAGIATAVAVWLLTRPARAAPVSRYGVALPDGQTPAPDGMFRLAPDGSRFVFGRTGPDGAYQLWVKERDRYEATPLAGTENAFNFTLSPDGQWIAFAQGGLLKKLPILGGAAITLADSVSTNPGLAWLEDESLVYVHMGARELHRVAARGGPDSVVWRSDSATSILPSGLPGGRGVLFTRFRGGLGADRDVLVLDLRSGDARPLIPGAAMAQYLPTGHVVYGRPDGAMLAVAFDLGAMETRGSPVPVLDSVAVLNGVVPLFHVADDGTLLVRPGAALSTLGRYEMVWVDRAGRETPIDSSWTFRHQSQGANVGWALSPDGTRLAIGLNTEAGDDIWVKQLPTGPLQRVSFDSASEYRPRWSPDGRYLVFGSFRGPGAESNNIYRRPADGTGADEVVLDLPRSIFEAVWSRDGRWLLARTGGVVGQVGGRDIYALRPGIDTTPRPLVVTPTFDEAAIALSPDARWLAYESNETGRTEVFIRPFPNTDSAKIQVSNGGGVAPLWAPSGRELFYVNQNREMVVVPIAPGPSLRLGERRTLFRMREGLYLANRENYTPHDISPDGSQFIMARRIGTTQQSTPLVVVENWFEELKQKLGRR
jgi:serine/threonine-protein kinase